MDVTVCNMCKKPNNQVWVGGVGLEGARFLCLQAMVVVQYGIASCTCTDRCVFSECERGRDGKELKYVTHLLCMHSVLYKV